MKKAFIIWLIARWLPGYYLAKKRVIKKTNQEKMKMELAAGIAVRPERNIMSGFGTHTPSGLGGGR